MNAYRMIRTALSAGAAVLAVALFSLMMLFPFRPVFFTVGIGWTAVFALALRRLSRLAGGLPIVPIAVSTTLASLALLTLVEWPPLRWFVVLFSGALAALMTALALGHHGAIVYEAKRVRRLFTMLWVFDAFAAATMLFALGIFFPHLPFSPFAVIGGAAFAAASFLIWRLYHEMTIRESGAWVGVFALIFAELFWAMHRLPFGSFAAGVLLTWLWYIATLLARFHFAPQEIVWRQQRWFLLANAALYILAVLWYVRWV
jgi:hypothetical protein